MPKSLSKFSASSAFFLATSSIGPCKVAGPSIPAWNEQERPTLN